MLPDPKTPRYDLVVIGGGINGTGIARDAAGRGLRVLLVEKGDLAAATSSRSSKLIHGGLRYLEQFEFRLVAEALGEREVLLKLAPHLVEPLRFVMPHVPELRPQWMIRAGLFLYDHLGRHFGAGASRRAALPPSYGVDLRKPPYDAGLKPTLTKGYIYSDCRVDDARLVLANATGARELGAEIRTRTECTAASRIDGGWLVSLVAAHGATGVVQARAIVNAAGPWVRQVLNERLGQAGGDRVKLVKGSHIVLPRLYDGEHAFILQNDDGRMVFMIPYEGRYTLVGTTDIMFDGDPSAPDVSAQEEAYLCRAVNRYLARPTAPAEVLWRYAGVRPLHDDGSANPSAVTRDYKLRVDGKDGAAPVLSVYGGKITTYRRLAEHVLDRLTPWFPAAKPAWTSTCPLPGGDLQADSLAQFTDGQLRHRYPWLPQSVRQGLARRHGNRAFAVLGDSAALVDLGHCFGAGLYAREVEYMVRHEWAESADDILYRRSKAGLHLAPEQRQALVDYLEADAPTP